MSVASKALIVLLVPTCCLAQSLRELQTLVTPQSLQLSSDGSRLWYQIGKTWWEVGTGLNPRPKPVEKPVATAEQNPPAVSGTRRLKSPRRSPDGKKIAYLDAEDPYGPLLLFCLCGDDAPYGHASRLSRMPIMDFQWAQDSNSWWVIGADGADEPVGRLNADGSFKRVSEGPAMRRLGGLLAANGVLIWVQSDGSRYGTIWVRDRTGTSRVLVDPNPQIAKWNIGVQEVVRWKNAAGEELQGVLARPKSGARLPLIVDPYSSWRNRFLNIPVLGNYMFVKEGFAVFFPDHRAPHTFPAMSFGESYVGNSKNRDPLDVLTDDVMSGVHELVRRGIADPGRLFLYSSSNGASAINQLLTQTQEFRAACSHGGVSDWLGYYEERRLLGDKTIPGFLGGREPEDDLELYRRISPLYQVDRITTPLLLVVGEKDTRFADAVRFYEAIRKAGGPVTLIRYPDEGHGIDDSAFAEQHVRRAVEFFRSARGRVDPPVKALARQQP